MKHFFSEVNGHIGTIPVWLSQLFCAADGRNGLPTIPQWLRSLIFVDVVQCEYRANYATKTSDWDRMQH